MDIKRVNSIWWCREEAEKQRDRIRFRNNPLRQLLGWEKMNTYREKVIVYPFVIDGQEMWVVEITDEVRE